MSCGVLYGVGVGPGDPELITLKGARVLAEADVILAASSTRNDFSLALDIVERHIRPGTPVERMGFPMTRDAAALEAAWAANADLAAGHLLAGRQAVFVTLGDPLTYSTFGYLFRTMRQRRPDLDPDCVRVVPGVTSFATAAAHVGQVLAESGESLTVIPGVKDEAAMRRLLEVTDNVAILKAYRNFPALRRMLTDMGLAGRSVLVTRLGLEGEMVYRDLAEAPENPHYFSLILVRAR